MGWLIWHTTVKVKAVLVSRQQYVFNILRTREEVSCVVGKLRRSIPFSSYFVFCSDPVWVVLTCAKSLMLAKAVTYRKWMVNRGKYMKVRWSGNNDSSREMWRKSIQETSFLGLSKAYWQFRRYVEVTKTHYVKVNSPQMVGLPFRRLLQKTWQSQRGSCSSHGITKRP